MYDIRTAILPFMFIFNVNLLLLEPDGTPITSWFRIVVVFVTAVIAMFAFANLTQNFFIAKNRIYEALLLAVVVWMLMRPDWFIKRLPFLDTSWGKYAMYAVGLVLYGLIYLMQRPRIPHQTTVAAA
jgi:TRAP-type uncharacterized transport system fused permease subunit